MGYLIDTSIFVAYERSGAKLSGLIDQLGTETLAMAAITASELLHGVFRADNAVRREKRQRFAEALFATMPVLRFDLEVARVHAKLWADIAARGLAPGAHDLQIAATAVFYRSSVVTHNLRHFRRIEGLEVVEVS